MSLLHQLGYSQVRHYPGGLKEWFETAASSDRIEPRPASLADAARRAPSMDAPADARVDARPRARAALSWSARFIDVLADRSVGSLFWLWLVIVVVCAIVDWLLALAGAAPLLANGQPIAADVGGLASALYFSAITATSVGYGDIAPVGAARPLAIAESVAGLILFGCVVSKFVSRRQEQLIGEIHHIAFEDRLGRVRTNLHLVRTEIQATTRLCEGRDIAPPEAIARVESAAMIFVGELHAVHDLLYRPQQAPDEMMLEAILASLASALREFNELLTCVQAGRLQRVDALSVSVTTMSRLAREICGDCVPREFAPALRTWMDEIQRIAGGLSQI